MMKRSVSLFVTLCACAAAAHATIIPYWVTDGVYVPNQGFGGNFHNASVSVYIDPAQTTWIAWHDKTEPTIVNNNPFVGGYNWLGVDDYLNLTVTTPAGNTYTRRMDYNGSYGDPSGPQAVIFGAAPDAPNVERWNFSQQHTTFDLPGLFNDVITDPGTYTFDFAFHDAWYGSYGHTDIYLLVDAVPEPASLILLAFGSLLTSKRRRR
jgi:hypothetical protein